MLKFSGFNVSEYFSDGNKEQQLIRLDRESQWTGVDMRIDANPPFPILRFPCGQRQMHQNSEAIWGRGNIRTQSPLNFINEFIKLCNLNKASVCYVLNLNDEMQYGDDLMEMHIAALSAIKSAGIQISLIEFGNEVYMNPQITGGPLGLTFKSGVLYQTLVRSNNINAARSYCEKARIYKAVIENRVGKFVYAACLAQEQNQSFRDWNETVTSNIGNTADGYAFHPYVDKPAVNETAIRSAINSFFGRMVNIARSQKKDIYITEIALENKDQGMRYIDGYDRFNFWKIYGRLLTEIVNPRFTLIWRLGGSNTNSYNYYKL